MRPTISYGPEPPALLTEITHLVERLMKAEDWRSALVIAADARDSAPAGSRARRRYHGLALVAASRVGDRAYQEEVRKRAVRGF